MNFPGLRHTILMSEPEAAALFTARWLTRREDAESLVVSSFSVILRYEVQPNEMY